MHNSVFTATRSEALDHAEGAMTRSVEYQVAKLPSDVWLGAALGSIGLALILKLNGRREDCLFVGQWAAPFLLMGVYMKLVKIGGSDRVQRNS
jgi:cbb3-type cytochrome oxidase subunit 1